MSNTKHYLQYDDFLWTVIVHCDILCPSSFTVEYWARLLIYWVFFNIATNMDYSISFQFSEANKFNMNDELAK